MIHITCKLPISRSKQQFVSAGRLLFAIENDCNLTNFRQIITTTTRNSNLLTIISTQSKTTDNFKWVPEKATTSGKLNSALFNNVTRRFVSRTISLNYNYNSNGSSDKTHSIVVSKPEAYVAHVQLNRPKVHNAFGLEEARSLAETFTALEDDTSVRVVVLSGAGPHLTSGVDLKSFMSAYGEFQEIEDTGRKAKLLLGLINKFQEPFKRMHSFSKPIICVVHGICYGLGMELAACSDIRYCSRDSKLAIREVLIGIAADVGSLQELPRVTSNQSLLHELVYTGRDFSGDEALKIGLVSNVSDSKESTILRAMQTASVISRKSPVAIVGSKKNIRFSRDKSFSVGLDYNAVWNMAMMQSSDVAKSISSIFSKQEETFDDF